MEMEWGLTDSNTAGYFGQHYSPQRVMKDNCVVICSSICNGYFHDEEFPAYRALYELFQKDYHNILPDCAQHA